MREKEAGISPKSFKPVLYIDIDGTICHKDGTPAEGLKEFLTFATDNFDCYWCTTHHNGDSERTLRYLEMAYKFDEDIIELLKKLRPTTHDQSKVDAIDLSKPFIWYDDYLLYRCREALEKAGKLDSWYKIDLTNTPDQLRHELLTLQSIISE